MNLATRTLINNKLESLVGSRVSEYSLNAKLSMSFGCDVVVAQAERDDLGLEDDLLDNHLFFAIEPWSILVDLFYLVDNSGNWYITETNFEFEIFN